LSKATVSTKSLFFLIWAILIASAIFHKIWNKNFRLFTT
jgi:hypothetical protein